MRFYELDASPDVVDFVCEVEDTARETLLVREGDDALELALLLPRRLLASDGDGVDPDGLFQALEGVSHFVYLAERARSRLPTTRLELELQAEVDKFVLSAIEPGHAGPGQWRALRELLFERVSFAHPEGSEEGERYRLANRLAARYVGGLVTDGEPGSLRGELRRFYRAGQTEKIRLARAA